MVLRIAFPATPFISQPSKLPPGVPPADLAWTRVLIKATSMRRFSVTRTVPLFAQLLLFALSLEGSYPLAKSRFVTVAIFVWSDNLTLQWRRRSCCPFLLNNASVFYPFRLDPLAGGKPESHANALSVLKAELPECRPACGQNTYLR